MIKKADVKKIFYFLFLLFLASCTASIHGGWGKKPYQENKDSSDSVIEYDLGFYWPDLNSNFLLAGSHQNNDDTSVNQFHILMYTYLLNVVDYQPVNFFFLYGVGGGFGEINNEDVSGLSLTCGAGMALFHFFEISGKYKTIAYKGESFLITIGFRIGFWPFGKIL